MSKHNKSRILQENALLHCLFKYGFLNEKILYIEYILQFTIKDLLEQRLQTFVYTNGFSRTIHQARVLIHQGHIVVNGKKTNISSFMVRVENQNKINFSSN